MWSSGNRFVDINIPIYLSYFRDVHVHQEKDFSLFITLNLEAVSPTTAKQNDALYLDQNELYTHGNAVSIGSFSDFKAEN